MKKIDSQQASAKAGTAAQNGWPHSGYSVSKACINAMTAVLARENPDVLINACCPGWVATDMGRQVGSRPPKTTGRPSEMQTLGIRVDALIVEGARIPLRLGFENIDTISGKYWANDSVAGKDAGRVQDW
jgi:carbonyl reductase 1